METWLIIVIGIVFLLLIGIIIWLVKRGKTQKPQEFACPKCGARVLADYESCPKCGRSFIVEKHVCPHCQKEVPKDASICDNCDTEFQFGA